MVHRWQYLLGIAVVGVSLVVEALFFITVENIMSINMIGRSCNLLADLIEVVIIFCGVVAVFDLQRKVRISVGCDVDQLVRKIS